MMLVNSNEKCNTTDCVYINAHVCQYQLHVIKHVIYSKSES